MRRNGLKNTYVKKTGHSYEESPGKFSQEKPIKAFILFHYKKNEPLKQSVVEVE